MMNPKKFFRRKSADRSSDNNPVLSFPAGEVVKQGYLFVKRPPKKHFMNFKAWHKRYFVLRDAAQRRCPVLEMYEKDELLAAPLGLTGPKFVMDLGHCVHIGYSMDSTRFNYALVIVCAARTPILLGSDDEFAARSWLLSLSLITHKDDGQWPEMLCPQATGQNGNRRQHSRHLCCFRVSRSSPSDLSPTDSVASLLPDDYAGFGVDTSFAREIFTVTVSPTEASERLKLKGDIQLVIFSYGVGLAEMKKVECFLVWPVAHIRQYQLESAFAGGRSRLTVVTLNVGRRSSTGEGTFQFRTHRGQDIIRELKKIVEIWSERKTLLSIHRCTNRNSGQASGPSCSRASTSSQQQRCQLTGAMGCSTLCTPSLAIPRLWQKNWGIPALHRPPSRESRGASARKASPSVARNNLAEQEAARSSDTEVNYVVPAFNDEAGNEEEEEEEERALTPPPPRRSPFQRVMKRQKRRRPPLALAAAKENLATRPKSIAGPSTAEVIRAETSSNSEESCYVEIIRGEEDIEDLPVKFQFNSASEEPKKEPPKNDDGEEEAYIEVLPSET